MNGAPPRWMSGPVSALLPPSRREEILGDLEERYRAADPTRAQRQYLFDAVTLVPAVFWAGRHQWYISRDAPPRLRLASGVRGVRAQVEGFQQENYCRTLVYGGMMALGAALIVWPLVSRDNRLVRLYLLFIVAALLFTAYQHYRRGGGQAVPAGASLPSLVAFHRRALERRRDFLQTLWYWKMLPLALPLLIEVAFERSGGLGSVVTLTGCFAVALTAARGQARRIQQQIDELERVPTAGAG
jgi:hypothetical protein